MAKKQLSFFEVEIGKNFSSGISTQVDWEPRTNIIETEQHLIIEVELPGVEKEDISIILHGSRELVIKGVKKQNRINDSQMTFYLFEREFGSFYKKILIDFPLDSSNITSSMDNGVLIVQIPKRVYQKITIDVK
jgi:HSP20 family protein